MTDKPDIEVALNPKEVVKLIGVEGAQLDPSFNEVLAQIEVDKAKKEADRKKLEELQAQAKPKPQALELRYIWVGSCPNDPSHQIKTLTLDNEAGYFVVCYCMIEDIQLKSEKVLKLNSKK